MKIGAAWLREWVRPRADAAAIAERLTLTGVETGVERLPGLSPRVVVGRIAAVTRHPDADRLVVCEVDAGGKRALRIVCGAPNARAGLCAPLALPGAELPGGVTVRAATVRGVASGGMLCSARELGLSDKSEGLLELDAGARPGTPLVRHLGLDDELLVPEITPNRGDCLSVKGLAREIAAVFNVPLRAPKVAAAAVTDPARFAVRIESRKDCPRYAGRAITGIDSRARLPDALRERLRHAGLRPIHPVVDITHIVMLELGQPMHAFDCARLTGGIRVRRARAGERLQLLDERTVELAPADLLIADHAGPLALAGIMGGAASGVGEGTTDIFLESACFRPETVAATARRLRLASDALYRFERGVDPALQREALERATRYVLDVCGGRAGPVTDAGNPRPAAHPVSMRRERLHQVIGQSIPDREVERLLGRLGIGLRRQRDGWRATAPSHRYDVREEVDLIEEVARLHGYDRLPARAYPAQLAAAPMPEGDVPLDALRDRLAGRGYQEVVTYSFVDPALQDLLAPEATAVAVDNPMAETMRVMRTTLWAGLVGAWRYNEQRQQRSARLFEAASCFGLRDGGTFESERIAGLAAGAAFPEQWGVEARPVDFHDVKADLEALLGPARADYRFEPAAHPALHPGRCARLVRAGAPVGWIGALHPRLVQQLDLATTPILFEVEAGTVRRGGLPRVAPLSEFPSARRDVAVLVPEEVTAERLLELVRAAGGPYLRDTLVFDVYRGTGLPNGCKSMALGLIFQDNSRTLTDEEVEAARQAVVDHLKTGVGASVRG